MIRADIQEEDSLLIRPFALKTLAKFFEKLSRSWIWPDLGCLAKVILSLLLATALQADQAPEIITRALRVGELEGTPGEREGGYPYRGTRLGGEISLKSLIQSKFEGSSFELQRDDSFPRGFLLQHLRLFSGRDGSSLFDFTWEQPTEDDNRFEGIYRDCLLYTSPSPRD